jgi:hypothetical protein
MLGPSLLARFAPAAVTATALLAIWSCGHSVKVGTVVERVDVSKRMLSPLPPDEASKYFGNAPEFETTKAIRDVAGVSVGSVSALPRGRGVEISYGGHTLATLSSQGYLTDFCALQHGDPRQLVVTLYTYPHENRAGKFTVMNAENREQLSTWLESPAPGGCAMAVWGNSSVILYIEAGRLVARSEDGVVLAVLDLPNSEWVAHIHAVALQSERLIVVGTGDGYTQFHLVSVVNTVTRQIEFEEINKELAFDLRAVGANSFDVIARSARWRYSLSGVASAH